MLSALGRTATALLIGAVGGAVFVLLGLPLPWTLGAITSPWRALGFGPTRGSQPWRSATASITARSRSSV
jgi:hypothetical protein